MKTIVFLLLLTIGSVSGANFFYLQRIQSSCVETRTEFSEIEVVEDNCSLFNWTQITTLTTNYTTYTDSASNETFYARIGALTVRGQIDSHNLDYQCPPVGYNGVAPGCQVSNDTQLVVLHVSVSTGEIHAMDVILSGAPFPSPQDLQDNRPPFGKARYTFSPPLRTQSGGYQKVCKQTTSDQCPNKNIDAKKLPYPLPSNYGYGIFGIQSFDLVANSTWIMDDSSQLLIVSAGNFYYYFNRSGFHYYDSMAKTCVWFSSCNYECEVYNYNSRFLDYAGEWIVTSKWGISNMQPVTVDAWIGNAIDAAGIFPVIMYTHKASGHYLGLDKLDTTPSARMGSTYWYTTHGHTITKVSILGFRPSIVEAGCVMKSSDWTGFRNGSAQTVRFHYTSFFIALFLTYCFLKN